MGDRSQALTITFANIGAGTVVRNVPPERLAQPTSTGVLDPTITDQAFNVSLFEGLASRRPGYATFGPALAGNNINSLYNAAFDPQLQYLVRGYNSSTGVGGGVDQYEEGGDTWITITPSSNVSRMLVDQPWQFAMVPSGLNTPANTLMFANPVSSIYTWNTAGVANSALAITGTNHPVGPHAIAAFLSRAFVLNVDDGEGTRRSSRLQWSAINNGRDWSSLTSGNLNIDDDPYPGVALAALGGRLCVFKGGYDGGAIYVCTPTGLSIAPLRVDAINPDTKIGPVIPRSVLAFGATTLFFLGHDAAYLYDGVRALVPFAEGVARNIYSRLNPKALNTGFAVYRRFTGEIELHVAVGASTVPNEFWVFDPRQKRAYGPHVYADFMLGATLWTPQGALTWDTWGQAAGRTWDTLTNAVGTEYSQWDRARDPIGTETLLYAGNQGQIFQSDGSHTTDDDSDIICTYALPPITPKMWERKSSGGGLAATLSRSPMFRDDDVLVLRGIHIRHRSSTIWTPIVEVSTDGSSLTTVSDGTTTAASSGRLVTKAYTGLAIPTSWCRIHISNTNGDELSLFDVTAEFTYAGSERHE